MHYNTKIDGKRINLIKAESAAFASENSVHCINKSVKEPNLFHKSTPRYICYRNSANKSD